MESQTVSESDAESTVRTVTCDELREMATIARPDLESYMNCNPINVVIKDYLLTEDIDVELIVGTVSKRRSHVGGEEHMFIQVSPECVSDVDTHQPIIVDGALDQFNISKYDNGEVFVSLGPKEDIPNPAVITPGDDLYDVFYTEEGW